MCAGNIDLEIAREEKLPAPAVRQRVSRLRRALRAMSRGLAWAVAACVPMALAVSGVRGSLPLAVAVGALSWAATLAAALRLRPGLARELVGASR